MVQCVMFNSVSSIFGKNLAYDNVDKAKVYKHIVHL